MASIMQVRQSSLSNLMNIIRTENAPIVLIGGEWCSEEGILIQWMEDRVRDEVDVNVDWRPIIQKICFPKGAS